MSQPSNRQELIDYCKRKLGYPVLEINVADEQIQDLVDDALQLYHERHYDGVYPTFFKYKITQHDVDRGRDLKTLNVTKITTNQTNIAGISTTFEYEENDNYLEVPDNVIGINKIFSFDDTNGISQGMFSLKYQMFLNDIYYWGTSELLSYAMTKTYLEDLDFLLTTQKQIRYNKRQNRLYLDIDWSSIRSGDFIVIDCYAILDPMIYNKVWNDSFVKKYLTALIKKQWGQNMIKFTGVKLPGGIEFNGRQLYDDAQQEIDTLLEKMSTDYELPPLDMIG